MNKKIEISCKRFRNMPWRKLKRFQGNLKQINSESLERLKGSILKHGFAAPMFIWHEHDDILDGHQRIAAIESFVEDGYDVPDKMPVVEIVAPTRKRALELVLHYNSQHGKMDENSLLEYALDSNLEWEDLSQIAYDLPGIDYAEFEREWNLNKDDTYNTDEDEIPEVTEAITKTGDLWLLGDHRVLCGDATKKEDVERLMDGQKADMVFTDPPYGISLIRGNSGKVGGGTKQYPTKELKNFAGDSETLNPEFVLSYSNKCVVWGGNYFASNLPESRCWFIWDKNHPTDRTFAGCELAWTNLVGHSKIYHSTWDGWTKEGESGSKLHPTQKPIKLCSDILNDVNEKNVLDLFLGSGSTLIACEKTNRKCYGMEIDKHYCDIIVKRWEDFTGYKASIN